MAKTKTVSAPIGRFPLLAAVFVIALLLRLVFIPNPGFEADISFWKSWGLAPFDRGIVWSMHNTNNNYPAPFAYLLWFMTWVYSWFADPHNFNEFWSNTNLLFLTIAKLPAILADLGIAGLILWFGRQAKRFSFPPFPFVFYVILAVLYLFNPVSVMDSAWWGQVDALGVVVFLAAVAAALYKKPFLAGLLYMVALMTKLQTMIYGPLFFLFLWQDMGLTGLVYGVTGASVAFFGLNIQFLLARDMNRVWQSLTDNYDYFPLLSLNAYNLWWIVAKGNGMHVSDKLAAVGFANAKTTGLIVFASGYLLAALTQIRQTAERFFAGKTYVANESARPELVGNFFASLLIAVSSFFLFQTESHDRYAFPVIVLFLLWLPFFVWTTLTKKERTSWQDAPVFRLSIAGYAVFTVFYFLNLHTAFADNYPKNVFPFLLFLNRPAYTMTIAAALLLLFGLFLYTVRKISGAMALTAASTAVLVGLLVPNLPLLTKKPVPLSKLTPFSSRQEYGHLVKDMPVNASGDSGTWNRLSVQYAFYGKGLGTHANSDIAYDINRKFSRFTTDVGIDTEAGPQGSVVFEVWGDGKLLCQSAVVKRFELPGHCDVDVSGVKTLQLKVTDAGDGINDDHADWLNPLLWP